MAHLLVWHFFGLVIAVAILAIFFLTSFGLVFAIAISFLILFGLRLLVGFGFGMRVVCLGTTSTCVLDHTHVGFGVY